MDHPSNEFSSGRYYTSVATYFLLPAVLVSTWLCQSSREVWNWLDTKTFYFLNHTVVGLTPNGAQSWAWINMRSSEWIFALAVFGTVLLIILTAKERRKTLWHYFFSLIYLGLAVELARRMTHYALLQPDSLHRLSPSLQLPDAMRVSVEVPHLLSKDYSTISFPGDHGVAFFTWALFVWRISKWKWGLWAFFIATLCSLPRMVVGAHWFSDTVVGGISIAAVLVGSFAHSIWEWRLLKWKQT